MRSDYNLTRAQKADVYVKCPPEMKSVVEEHELTIVALTTSSACLVTDSAPTGCAISTIGNCEAHLLLKGLVDPEKEKERLAKKVAVLEQSLGKLQVSMSLPDYDVKVPADVRQANSEKVVDINLELTRLQESISTLSLMA